ncbi:hypothetical protein MPSEU_000416000 [Mayamaea pseudoterrestris]|nr:hypothetical protein MPSEU_000416000 [Mayamaea pseudoterrestris]
MTSSSSQKEFTFPVASTKNSLRVVRPTRNLGEALKATASSSKSRSGSGTTASMSVSSRSEMSSASKKYTLAPTRNSSNSNHHGSNSSLSNANTAMQRRKERRQQSASSGKPIEALPGGSFHASFHYQSTSEPDDDDDDAFENQDEWWDEQHHGTSSDFAAATNERRNSIQVRKTKVHPEEFGANNNKSTASSLLNARHKESLAAAPKASSSRRLDQALASQKPLAATPGDCCKSVQSSMSSRGRKLESSGSRAPTSRSVSRSGRSSLAVPTSSLLGTSSVVESPAKASSTRTSVTRSSRPRGKSVEAPRVNTLLSHGRPQRKTGATSSAGSVVSAPAQMNGRVKVGRVARPSGNASSSTSAANTSGTTTSSSSSAANRYGFPSCFSGNGSCRNLEASTHTVSFDPFAVSEHEQRQHQKERTAQLPLQVQRKGKYSDKEKMLRKIKEIGISEHMLQNMKQAGLVITETKR